MLCFYFVIQCQLGLTARLYGCRPAILVSAVPASGSELASYVTEDLFLLIQLGFLAQVMGAQLGDLIMQLLYFLAG
jgi:hypothetical protein